MKQTKVITNYETTVNKTDNVYPKRINYKSAYFNKPIRTAEAIKIENKKFPNAQRQNPITDSNRDKYLGRYYGYEIDTYFDIVPADNHFQMKYADNTENGYIDLLDFSDEARLTTRTCGDWGEAKFPIQFYGDEQKIDFFVLQRGMGHFLFLKCDV